MHASDVDPITHLPDITYQGLYSFDHGTDWAKDDDGGFLDSWNFAENLEQEWEGFLNGSFQ